MKKSRSLIPVLLSLLLLTACSGGEIAAEEPYGDSLQNADVLIDLPNLRQYGGYTCGTTCVQMVMNWLFPYEGDLNLATYEELLATNEDAGTPPQSILRFFDENGVPSEVREGMTTAELVGALDALHPLLMPLQAWSTADDGSFNTENSAEADTYLVEGHWVICVGYRKDGDSLRFYFNDPACVGHCYLDEDELNARWIDMAYDGEIFDHYAIEICSGTDYDPDGVYHMD